MLAVIAGGRWLALAVALACGDGSCAEPEVYLLRGWLGVFSTGMDTMAEKLRADGVKAEAIMHLAWKDAVLQIVKERQAGEKGALALIGHSQGANDAIKMARELDKHEIAVDLLVTLVPFMQDPVPPNVMRAINYYQSPGWGMPLTVDAGFKGKLSNINVAGDSGTFHITIDKSARVQAEILDAIAALPR